MSGTSADGIDVALVAIGGRGLEMTAWLVHHHAAPYTPELRGAILAARSDAKIALADLATLARDISLAYAQAVNAAFAAARIRPADCAAIAAHGQTLFHQPPTTIQWLDPALLAAHTDCTVVSDFRRADCAAGGQGAPLVPLADFLLFRHPKQNRILLNLGGIANLTRLDASCVLDDVIAFDTGPANCISDWLMRFPRVAGELARRIPSAPLFDLDGQRALRGKVHAAMLTRLMSNDYFRQPPPKSPDGPQMQRLWDQAARDAAGASLDDLLATACAWSAAAVVAAIPPKNVQIIASGGGTRNHALMSQLRHRLPPSAQLLGDEALGFPSSAKEAIAFALLGAATLDGLPGNVPSATGAARAVVLGSITPKPGPS